MFQFKRCKRELNYNQQQNDLRHSPIHWAFLRFIDFKRGKLVLPYPLHAMLCHCSRYHRNDKHPNFEWRGQGTGRDVWIRLLSEVTLFEYIVSKMFSPILVWENRPHFAMPPVVSPRNDVNERRNSIPMTFHYPYLAGASFLLFFYSKRIHQSKALARSR